MASPVVIFCIAGMFLGKLAQLTAVTLSSSSSLFVAVKTGENLTLSCLSDINAKCYWYKQTPGQKITLLSTFYKYEDNNGFHGEFKNNQRFKLDNEKGKNHLTIEHLQNSDSAIYHCISCYANTVQILETITVNVEVSGLDVQAVVHQSVSETVHLGGSVILNCTVYSGTCDGKHSVYWFKDSGESEQGIIYNHGDRNDQCERKTETQTNTCVYYLPLMNLTRSPAATYYCAVALCGRVLFGNGTKLEFMDDIDHHTLVFFLSGALTFLTLLVAFLVFLLYTKINSSQPKEPEPRARLSSPHTTIREGHPDADNPHYAALGTIQSNRLRKQKDGTESHCVYASVKL